ncbi:MAG: redox-regulated ATPase YchF [Candidatus Nezhaarchaeales archaeon]
MVLIGLIGKTNTGKTTFFNAATLLSAEVSTYPFTTKRPEVGIAYVQTPCVCREFKVKDNPRNSTCIDGWRFIPIQIMDLPGLIKGAWTGRGLGNQFLSAAMSADALLHIVDASGSIDEDGEIAEPGTGDPLKDAYDIEEEILIWLLRVVEGNKGKILRMLSSGKGLAGALSAVLSGLKIREVDVVKALVKAGLQEKDFKEWSREELKQFVKELRWISKPTLIVANKMDLPQADENYKRLVEAFGYTMVVSCSAEAELALRRAELAGLIRYIPGDELFKVVEESKLTSKQRWALDYVQRRVFDRYFRTGVQFAINFAIFKLLRMNVVYPVEDEGRLSDGKGNVLPDAYLMPPDSTVFNLAEQIHTELAKSMMYAIDVRSGVRLPKEYVLRDRDVVKIVTTVKKK